MPFRLICTRKIPFDRLSGPNPPDPPLLPPAPDLERRNALSIPSLTIATGARGEPGIKAILIYPHQSPLATDQAGRLAKLIHNSTLKGHVTAGIYIGQQERTIHARRPGSAHFR